MCVCFLMIYVVVMNHTPLIEGVVWLNEAR